MTIRFTALGDAKPAGSKRAFIIAGKARITDANKNSKPWKAVVSSAAREAYSGELLRGPLIVTITFYRPRPKGHYGSGRNANALKQSAAKYPTSKPDVLKLARAVEDAMTGVVYADDAQIVTEMILKRYGEPARAEVIINEA